MSTFIIKLVLNVGKIGSSLSSLCGQLRMIINVILMNGLRCQEALPSVSNGSHCCHRKEMLMSTDYDNVV